MIREIVEKDYRQLNYLTQTIERKSEYMLFGPNERVLTDQEQWEIIKTIKKQNNAKIFVSEMDGKLTGWLLLRGDNIMRRAHVRYLAMGVLREYYGKKQGQQLFEKAIDFCQQNKVLRVELVVDVRNVRAIGLYKKMGFEIEGTFKKAKLIDDVLVDEYSMSRIF